jgi:hypothetical protein
MLSGNDIFYVIVTVLLIGITITFVTIDVAKNRNDIVEMEQLVNTSADVKKNINLQLDRMNAAVKRFKRVTIKANRDMIKSNIKRKKK